MKTLIYIFFITLAILSCNRRDKTNSDNSKDKELATENIVKQNQEKDVYHDLVLNIDNHTTPEYNQNPVIENNEVSTVTNQNSNLNSYNENILDSMISDFEKDIVEVDTTKSCNQMYQSALNVLENFFKIVELIELNDIANINKLRKFESYTNKITPILEKCDKEYNDFMEIFDDYNIKYRSKIELIFED